MLNAGFEGVPVLLGNDELAHSLLVHPVAFSAGRDLLILCRIVTFMCCCRLGEGLAFGYEVIATVAVSADSRIGAPGLAVTKGVGSFASPAEGVRREVVLLRVALNVSAATIPDPKLVAVVASLAT